MRDVLVAAGVADSRKMEEAIRGLFVAGPRKECSNHLGLFLRHCIVVLWKKHLKKFYIKRKICI